MLSWKELGFIGFGKGFRGLMVVEKDLGFGSFGE